MKHPIEKQFEHTMRFFTPELYLKYNSGNDAEADAAEAEWEAALQAYQAHVEAIRSDMPASVCKLTELSLHDADILASTQEIEPLLPLSAWSAVAILSVKRDDHLLSLVYLLWDRVREFSFSNRWPFSKKQRHWLYDEVDIVEAPRGMFVHRILASDGIELEIPFLGVIIHRVPLTALADKSSRKSA